MSNLEIFCRIISFNFLVDDLILRWIWLCALKWSSVGMKHGFPGKYVLQIFFNIVKGKICIWSWKSFLECRKAIFRNQLHDWRRNFHKSLVRIWVNSAKIMNRACIVYYLKGRSIFLFFNAFNLWWKQKIDFLQQKSHIDFQWIGNT